MAYPDPQEEWKRKKGRGLLPVDVPAWFYHHPLQCHFSPLFYLVFTEPQQDTDNTLEIIQLQPCMKNSSTELGKPHYVHVMATEMTDAKLERSHLLLSL